MQHRSWTTYAVVGFEAASPPQDHSFSVGCGDAQRAPGRHSQQKIKDFGWLTTHQTSHQRADCASRVDESYVKVLNSSERLPIMLFRNIARMLAGPSSIRAR
jgi:hypothetical protein